MLCNKVGSAWEHFVVLDENFARCKHCDKKVIARGSPRNLFRHMKIHHSFKVEKYANCKDLNETKSTTIPSEDKTGSDEVSSSISVVPHKSVTEFIFDTSSETITNCVVSPKFSNASVKVTQQPATYYLIQPDDENKQKELDKQLLRIIVKNFIPFSIVEGLEFIRFVSMLNSIKYVLPSKKKLSNDILVSVYESSANKLKCILKTIDAAALTVDSWTSVNNEYFIGFTIHYLNKNLELKSNFLQCFSSDQAFSSVDIALFIEGLESDWNLCNKILAVITDGSEEIIKAIDICNLNHISCFAQILNQIVEAGLEELNPLILKVRDIVQYFRKNSMALSKFYIIQNEMGLSDSKITCDTPSKWDTTFNMLTTFLKNKVALLGAIEQLQLYFFKFSSTDFLCLERAVKILIIFNSVKINMCSENHFSISKIPHMIHFMSNELEDILKDTTLPLDIIKMGNTMKDQLKIFEELQRNEIVCQAVLLDPRLKRRGFPSGFFEEACNALSHNVVTARQELIHLKNKVPDLSQMEQSKLETESEYCIDMWSEFESEDLSPVQNHKAAASVELEAFLNDLYLPVEDNPLSYWANISNQNKFPALFELAKRVLCIPATSVPCQQIYSEIGHNFVKKRKFLFSSKADKILFLHNYL